MLSQLQLLKLELQERFLPNDLGCLDLLHERAVHQEWQVDGDEEPVIDELTKMRAGLRQGLEGLDVQVAQQTNLLRFQYSQQGWWLLDWFLRIPGPLGDSWRSRV